MKVERGSQIATEPASAEGSTKTTFSNKWTQAVERVHQPILRYLHGVADVSANNPKRTTWGVVALSFLLLFGGIFTNFESDAEDDSVWTPNDSAAVAHWNWVDKESGFPAEARSFFMFFHANGDNVLGASQVSRIFEALDAVQGMNDYIAVCNESTDGDCPVDGVVDFWNQTAAIFDQEIGSGDQAALEAMSKDTYPDGTPVAINSIFGKPERNDAGELVVALSYTVRIDFPDTDKAEDFEGEAVDVILALDKKWEGEAGNSFRVEVTAAGSFGDEFERAIIKDIPLVPIVFIVMGIFTCAVFFKRDQVQSRSLLGFAAVRAVTLSLISGYGLMFLIGVPFTSMTQILPFVIYGVGLDDAFIIMGSYCRKDPSKDAITRIHETIDDIGVSITLTTMTSMLAFGLGATSTIPTVYWVCYYAMTALAFVFLYQTTYFIASVVLDEKRIQENRRDCCTCCTVPQQEESSANDNRSAQDRADSQTDRFMVWYAKKILHFRNKVIIIVVFAVIAVMAAISATKLEQAFDLVDVLPDESYVADFYDALEEYTLRSEIAPGVYFRYVDQSDPAIQTQMETYVKELVEIESILFEPEYFWLRDFRKFVNGTAAVQDKTFVEQLDAFLDIQVYRDLYNEDLVRADNGTILSSRCFVHMDDLDLEDVKDQIDALEDTKAVTASQSINEGKEGVDYPFFANQGIFDIWEFYAACVDELIFTSVMGVCAVTIIALVFIPHWTAAFFVLPMMCLLYINLLGFLQWAGVAVNPISYIALVMSIGLLVDFVMHPLLRYYESNGTRYEKTVELLHTMGSSILIGAVSTLLGTMILAFSSSEIFSTIFYAFVGLVTIGAAYGLILLPVVLSIVGPENDKDHPATNDEDEKRMHRDETGRTDATVF